MTIPDKAVDAALRAWAASVDRLFGREMMREAISAALAEMGLDEVVIARSSPLICKMPPNSETGDPDELLF